MTLKTYEELDEIFENWLFEKIEKKTAIFIIENEREKAALRFKGEYDPELELQEILKPSFIFEKYRPNKDFDQSTYSREWIESKEYNQMIREVEQENSTFSFYIEYLTYTDRLISKMEKNNSLEKDKIELNLSNIDISRLYKALKQAGIINISGASFSKFFLNEKGKTLKNFYTEGKEKIGTESKNEMIRAMQIAADSHFPENTEK